MNPSWKPLAVRRPIREPAKFSGKMQDPRVNYCGFAGQSRKSVAPHPYARIRHLSGDIFEHKRPSTVLLKSSVLVNATPRGGKHEIDAVASFL
ncbi:MAG: hypothetical protein DMG39_23045 [Acidobacteria bacterium]|nr:MAG: hypothetical protein DMG39_23045 [Acidobacteriota bacterium]